MNEPGDKARMQPGPGFENALRNCLVSGIILIDSEKNQATISPEAREILGLSEQELPEIPIDRLPGPVLQLAREALASGKPISARQLLLPSDQGNALIHGNAVPLNSLSRSSAVLTLHKISSTTEFFQQIRQLDRLANTGTLAAGMAHEIKNALVAGRTFLDLLLEKNTDEDLVQIVRRENGRIDAIVTRMLRFAGTNTTSLKALHLHDVLEHALRLIQPQFRTKSISLEQSLEANPDALQGDEYELQQAFVNLLLNALEAMGENGQLRISTSNVAEKTAEPPRIQATIQDSGLGILPEHIEHLFEPFFTTKQAGTGLGLAVTQRIIQEHGGSISVHSQPGLGTTFTVRLPPLAAAPDTALGGFATSLLGRRKN